MGTKTWFITGTSSGFGRQLTELVLAKGGRVAATLRKPEALRDLADIYGDRLWVRTLDVTESAQIREVVTAAFTDLGQIDVVVSNAGYGLLGAAEELTDEQITHQIDTNLVGSIQFARAVLPFLRAQGGGRLVQIASMGGQIAFPALSLYHATKWGIEGFYEALAPEVAPFGIGVTLVEPGGARTQFAGTSAIVGPPLDAYVNGPTGWTHGLGSEGMPITNSIGDPLKVAQAIVDSVDLPEAPFRLTLGSDAYELITASLQDRLSALEQAKELAYSTDVDDVIASRSN